MISSLDLSKVKNKTKEFFEKMGFLVDIDISLRKEDDTVLISLNSEEPRILIGRNGEVLADVQKVLGNILKRMSADPFSVDLDINGYKEKKTEYLKETAKNIADRVSLTKKEKALEPMPSYERRIVHLELAKRDDVETESQGEGGERRVVIKPKGY